MAIIWSKHISMGCGAQSTTPRGYQRLVEQHPFPSKSNTAIRMMAAAFLTPSATAITESAFDPPQSRQLVPALLVNFCW
jgi:hypothetical protein